MMGRTRLLIFFSLSLFRSKASLTALALERKLFVCDLGHTVQRYAARPARRAARPLTGFTLRLSNKP